MTVQTDLLGGLAEGLSEGDVDVVDLTHPLGERTPVIELPEPFANTPGFRLRELSRYDERGAAWYWNAIEGGEHVGTHFDAPVHWVTGRDREDVASVAAERLVGPCAVLDWRAEAAEDPDRLVEIDDVRAFEEREAPLPDDGWLLLRTGWEERHDDRDAFLGLDAEGGPHWPGISPACARWLADEAPIRGLGVETVGIDAGRAYAFDPPFPAHHHLLGAGKYGLASLAALGRLPATGAVLVAAPLKIEGGSGSSMRALALVPGA